MITFLKSNLTFGTTNTMSTIIINYQLIINIKFRTIIRIYNQLLFNILQVISQKYGRNL